MFSGAPKPIFSPVTQHKKAAFRALQHKKRLFIVLFQKQRALRMLIPAGPLRSPESARRSGRGCAAGQTGVFLIVLHHYITVSILSQVRHYFEDSLLIFLLRASLLCSRSLVQYVTAFSRQKVTVSFQMLPSRNIFSLLHHTHFLIALFVLTYRLFYLNYYRYIVILRGFTYINFAGSIFQFYRINAIF